MSVAQFMIAILAIYIKLKSNLFKLFWSCLPYKILLCDYVLKVSVLLKMFSVCQLCNVIQRLVHIFCLFALLHLLSVQIINHVVVSPVHRYAHRTLQSIVYHSYVTFGISWAQNSTCGQTIVLRGFLSCSNQMTHLSTSLTITFPVIPFYIILATLASLDNPRMKNNLKSGEKFKMVNKDFGHNAHYI